MLIKVVDIIKVNYSLISINLTIIFHFPSSHQRVIIWKLDNDDDFDDADDVDDLDDVHDVDDFDDVHESFLWNAFHYGKTCFVQYWKLPRI